MPFHQIRWNSVSKLSGENQQYETTPLGHKLITWSRMEKLEVVSLRAEEREFVLLVAAVVVCEFPLTSDRSDGWRRLIIFEKPSNRVSGTEMIAEPTAFNGFISEET